MTLRKEIDKIIKSHSDEMMLPAICQLVKKRLEKIIDDTYMITKTQHKVADLITELSG